VNEQDVKTFVQPYRFVALKDFEALRSHYVKGMAYTVRPGNDALHQRVQRWAAEGLVEVHAGPVTHVLPSDLGSLDARVSGSGEVH
jgi:hypothetical protein